jgi:hypothetical protein
VFIAFASTPSADHILDRAINLNNQPEASSAQVMTDGIYLGAPEKKTNDIKNSTGDRVNK